MNMMQMRHETSDTTAMTMTKHAIDRMNTRGFSRDAVSSALAFGRVAYIRGIDIHAIGKKEVATFRKEGIDLSRFEGIHVLVSPDGSIVTVYRNRDFTGLRRQGPRKPRRRS